MSPSILDEAYDRLSNTGPEWNGWLSNHGPMVVEVLARYGHEHTIHRWLDSYLDRLEERPRGIRSIPVDDWRDPLGDPTRTGDWLTYFDRELRGQSWRGVLLQWWPRLLPGIAAGATHGVIRVGHVVAALLDEETPARVSELGQGLAYWAARWQPLTNTTDAESTIEHLPRDPRARLDAVPLIPEQRSGIRARLAQLADQPGWARAAGAVPGSPGDGVATRLAGIVEAAVGRHATHGYANPVMLVHAATAPNAVLRALPALPEAVGEPSLRAAWAATAAITAAYAPRAARPMVEQSPPWTVEELIHLAADSGAEHAIKFADAAITAHQRGGATFDLVGVATSVGQIAAD